MSDHRRTTGNQVADGRSHPRARRAAAIVSCGALVMLPSTGGAFADGADECRPRDAWTEVVPGTMKEVPNPDYQPPRDAVMDRRWIEPVYDSIYHEAEIKHHEAEWERKYMIDKPYWTVEHKTISVGGLPVADAARVIAWLERIGGTDVGGGWWQIPDAVIAGVDFNPVTVPDTGDVGLSAYGGPNVTVPYRKTHEIHGTEPSSGFGITQNSVDLYWTGSAWVTGLHNAAWVKEAPPYGVLIDERQSRDAWDEVLEPEWWEQVEVRAGYWEEYEKEPAREAVGTPTIMVEQEPERVIEHGAIVCGEDPPTEPEDPTPTVPTRPEVEPATVPPSESAGEPARPVVTVTG